MLVDRTAASCTGWGQPNCKRTKRSPGDMKAGGRQETCRSPPRPATLSQGEAQALAQARVGQEL